MPGASSDVIIATGDAVASASIGTVNSITDSSDLPFRVGGNEYGHHLPRQHRSPARRPQGGAGGTILNIGGDADQQRLSARRQCHALGAGHGDARRRSIIRAQILLLGSSANQAFLDVTGSAGFGAAGVLSGNVATVRRQRDRVQERCRSPAWRLTRICSLQRKRRLHRGQHGAWVEQRSDRARFDRRRALCSPR